MDEVDLSSFARAIGRLEEAFTAYSAQPSNLFLRDSVVMRFLFTYELSLSSLLRFLETYSLNWKASANQTTPNVIRTGNQDGLVQSEWEVWQGYRDARNKISHTYNEDKAEEVVQVIPAFLQDVRYLHQRMETYPR